MTFMESIRTCFSKYVTFSGRAQRSEFWWFVLFSFLVALLLGWIPIIGQLLQLALFLPGLAVTARRLHDLDRTGWWMLAPYGLIIAAAVLTGYSMGGMGGMGGMENMQAGEGLPGALAISSVIGLIGLVFMILLIVWFATKGTDGDNSYGPDPLGGSGGSDAGFAASNVPNVSGD